METREAYAEKFMGLINQWKADIQKLKGKAQEASGDAKITYQDEITALEEQILKAEKQLETLRKSGEDTWVDLRENVKKSWDELTSRLNEVAE